MAVSSLAYLLFVIVQLNVPEGQASFRADINLVCWVESKDISSVGRNVKRLPGVEWKAWRYLGVSQQRSQNHLLFLVALPKNNWGMKVLLVGATPCWLDLPGGGGDNVLEGSSNCSDCQRCCWAENTDSPNHEFRCEPSPCVLGGSESWIWNWGRGEFDNTNVLCQKFTCRTTGKLPSTPGVSRKKGVVRRPEERTFLSFISSFVSWVTEIQEVNMNRIFSSKTRETKTFRNEFRVFHAVRGDP